MTIKHVVLSGGGAAGFTIYGIIKQLSCKNYLDIKTIETIHATSAGSIISILLILSNTWEELDDYMIKRPWDKLFDFNPSNLLNIWQNKGVLNENVFLEIYKPFFQVNDLDCNLTLKQLYDKKGIEINMYATLVDNDNFEKIIFSHKTYPDLEVYKAVAMSSAFPILFEPIFFEDKCVIDGGLLNNFPIQDCLENTENKDEIFAIKIISGDEDLEKLNKNTSLPVYLYNIISNMHILICNRNKNPDIKNVILCHLKNNGISRWIQCGNNEKVRKEYIDIGIEEADNFLKSKDL